MNFGCAQAWVKESQKRNSGTPDQFIEFLARWLGQLIILPLKLPCPEIPIQSAGEYRAVFTLRHFDRAIKYFAGVIQISAFMAGSLTNYFNPAFVALIFEKFRLGIESARV